MLSSRALLAAFLLPVVTCWLSSGSAAKSLQVTAIVGKDMKSTVECWTLLPEFMNVRGMNVEPLGDLSQVTYTEMPTDNDFEQGLYTAPNLQFFVILEGNATITFPTSDEVLHVQPNRLYIATDSAETSALGHITVVRAGSRILQLPFKNGNIPHHTAIHGECGQTSISDPLRSHEEL